MKAVDINSSTYIGLNKENNKEDPKFEVGDHVRILKCKSIFAKGYSSNWSEGVFVIKKDKKHFLGYILLVILIVKTLFCEKELQITLKIV